MFRDISNSVKRNVIIILTCMFLIVVVCYKRRAWIIIIFRTVFLNLYNKVGFSLHEVISISDNSCNDNCCTLDQSFSSFN